jgi:hypothetical protein
MTTELKSLNIEMTPGAYQAHSEAIGMIQKAHEWVTDFSTYPQPWNAQEWSEETKRRLASVDAMEASYLSNIVHLFMGTAMGAKLVVQRDGEGCFYWSFHNDEGRMTYNGGIIFHATHKDGERQPYGTWSTHT